MQGFFEVGVFAAAVIIIGWHGKYEQYAHFIAINMCSVTYMMVTGIAASGGIRVGHFWGLRDKPQIYVAGHTALGMAAGFMSLWGLVFLCFPNSLVWLYTEDSNVSPIAISLLMVGGLFQLSDGLQSTALGLLRGIADVNVPTVLALIAYWLVGLPIGYILSYTDGLKAIGMWFGLTAGLTASAIFLCTRFYRTVGKMQF
jgi:MATE family multidrug resistance protein